MDMLVKKNDFSRTELLDWTRLFIKARFGDSSPDLVEATGDEVSRCTPVLHEHQKTHHQVPRVRLLFVHHAGGPPLSPPEETLAAEQQLEIRTAWLGEETTAEVQSVDLEWADLIVVMDKRMRQLMHKRLRASRLAKRIICLYLPDHHDAREPDYASLLRERVFVYLDRLGWKPG